MDDALGDLDWKPKYNMEFDSEQASFDFYNEYGGREGFSVRRHYHSKNKHTGEITSSVFVCSKEGFRGNDKRDHLVQKPRAETRTGCNAKMHIKFRRQTGKFYVLHFVETHNHRLVSQELTHMLPSQRRISISQAGEIELAEDSGIPLRSAYELMGRQVGGRESLGYTKLDQKNYLRTKRQRNLAYGEAGSIIKYFSSQTMENPSFYYSIQLDDDEQITNMFWADAKMIIDYGQFGDVVSFDTTYKINKEHRPFAVFVGLNQHRQTIVFGAALMYDETVDSFVWLFETFFKAMSGKAPKTIFTDEDAAIGKAISIMMPDTFHMLCTWHMMQNALKHSNEFGGHGEAKKILLKFMKNYDDEDEFLRAWDAMLDEYKVHDNFWLKTKFVLRQKWAKAYVRWGWTAGMKSTQLSESFNASLKDYLKSDHDIAQFFVHFERVLYDKRYKELQAEYELFQKLPKVALPSKMLKQIGEIYTKAIFEDFQDQYIKSIELDIKNHVVDDGIIIYTVINNEHPWERHVKKDIDGIVSCSCRRFETKGVLCSHAIKVLREVMHIKDLPTQYIMKRWTREARTESVQDMHGREIEADPRLEQTFRYRWMCSKFTKISTKAAVSEKAFNLVDARLNELAQMVDKLLRSEAGGLGTTEHESPPITCEGNHEVNCLDDANAMKAKGLKKKKVTNVGGKRRIKSCVEQSSTKKKKSNSSVSNTIRTKSYAIEGSAPNPLTPSHSSQEQIQSLYMAGNSPYPQLTSNSYALKVSNSMSWLPYEGSQPQANNVFNSMSWMPYGGSLPTSFQALLHQNFAHIRDEDEIERTNEDAGLGN